MSSAVIMASWWAWARRLGESPLLRASVWLTAANLLVGLMGYIYQILMGRMLIPSEFALFSALMALFVFAASPLGAMFMVISRRVSTLRAQNRSSVLRTLYRRLHEVLAVTGALALFLLWAFMAPLQVWLEVPDSHLLWLIGVILVVSAFVGINNAFYQGQQQFHWLGGAGIAWLAMKIGFSVILIALGLGVSGALYGVLLSVALVWAVCLANILRDLPATNHLGRLPLDPFPLSTWLPVLVANVAFAAMTQLDMVLVKAFFSAEQAGLYAAASVLGKAVLYLPGGLVMALFPLVADQHARDQSSAHLMLQAVILVFVCCGGAALAYWAFGDWLIVLLYGPAYAGAGELLRWYGFAILPLALVMVAEHFLIAKGRVLFAWLFLAMAPLQVAAIALWHSHLWQVIAIIGGFGSLLVVIGYGVMWRNLQRATDMAAVACKTALIHEMV